MMHGNKVGTETAKPAFPLSAARPFSCLSGLLAHGPLSKSTVTDGGLSLTYERFQRVTALARFNARILVSYGDEASLRRARISEEDGLERMDEIKFAIFEASGRISIIPKRNIVTSEDGSAPGGD